MPASLDITVAAAGTRVPLSASTLLCSIFTIKAKEGNVGKLFVGGADVSGTVFGQNLDPGESFTFGARGATNGYNLARHFLDAATSGNGATVLYEQN